MRFGLSPTLNYQAREVGFYPGGNQKLSQDCGDLYSGAGLHWLERELSNFQEFYKVVDVILVASNQPLWEYLYRSN